MTAFPNLRLAAPPSNRDAWEAQRPALLEAMQQIMGPLPGPERRDPLDIQVQEETDCGSYTRRLITYVSEPDCRVPARPCKWSIPTAATTFPTPSASGLTALSPRHWAVWDLLTSKRPQVSFNGNRDVLNAMLKHNTA